MLLTVSAALVGLTVLGSFALTDDAWPFAPFRMFSYGNDPNGTVHRMLLHVDLDDGRSLRIGAEYFGLRRAELEEQTPRGRRVPDDKLAELARSYRGDADVEHLQVFYISTPMLDGEPQADLQTETVIGDWATDGWDGPRVDVDLPVDTGWQGYTS